MFLKPSVGSSSSVLSQHHPSQIYTLSPASRCPHNISLPPGLLGHPRSCFFPRSIHPNPSFPLTLNVSLPPGLLMGHPRSLPESQLPAVPQHKPSPLDSSTGEVDVIGLVLLCPLTTLSPRPMHWPSENLAPKLPQQWSNLDSLNCYPEPAAL